MKTIEITKTVLTGLAKATLEQVYEANKDYNPIEWKKKLTRYAAHSDIQFYISPKGKGNGYDYERYYATYTIEEGITFFGRIEYSSMITNRGFSIINILPNGEVTRTLLSDGKGNYGHGVNDKNNRKIFAKNSRDFGTIYSSEF